MPITFVSGDPLLTHAQTLAFGYNARGRTESSPLAVRLLDRAPAAFATFARQCRNGKIKSGGLWQWRETQPQLLFLTVRDSSVSSTRPRHIEAALMTLARDYRLYGITSIAIAPLVDRFEWPLVKPLIGQWLRTCPLPVLVYESYLPGIAAEVSDEPDC
ncbi:MAG: hypothetical protein K8I60_04070 [Anaerolineae bacterium]|nr:hypothetical protein [Anaerolineae bacterium]